MRTRWTSTESCGKAATCSQSGFWRDKFLKNLVKEKKSKAKDETLMTKEEFFAEVDEALEQAKRGEVTRFTNKEDMVKWLNSL